jgi:hypothetical protein
LADKIHKYLDKVDSLKEEVDRQSEDILNKIDVDELIANPVEYLEELGRQFFESHKDELEESIKAGEKKAKAILNEID